MNTHSYKIACPNCGATSGFTETAPSSYSCGYCGSAFEQATVIASKSQEGFLYDRFKELIKECNAIDPENPDRNTLWYSTLVQLNGCVDGLVASVFFQEVKEDYIEKLSQEIDYLKSKGVAAKSSVQEIVQKDLVVPTKFYSDYQLMLAECLNAYSKEPSVLEKALQAVVASERIYLELMQSVDHKITGLKLELLQRLEHTEQFETDLQTALQHSDTDFVKRIRYRFKDSL